MGLVKQGSKPTGTVTKIDINGSSLDLVTAFETVPFWTNIVDAFSEIFRILDNKGEFLIINSFPKEGTKWWKMAILK